MLAMKVGVDMSIKNIYKCIVEIWLGDLKM